MTRRALIIYCDNTSSGELTGPSKDNEIYRDYLQSSLGGNWYDSEIESINNPTASEVEFYRLRFLNGADYTFIIFSGHGYIDINNKHQYVELSDRSIPVLHLKTNAKRQTLIVDACRGYYQPIFDSVVESRMFNFAIGDPNYRSTRVLFESALMQAEIGWSILYAASQNESALDTNSGGAYLYSLYKASNQWGKNDKMYNFLGLNVVHELAKNYMNENIETIQVPSMNREKRKLYYPFAVKYT